MACRGWEQKRKKGTKDNGKTKVVGKNEQVSIENDDKGERVYGPRSTRGRSSPWRPLCLVVVLVVNVVERVGLLD